MISFSTSWKPALCVIWLQNMLLEIVFQQNTYSISNLKKIFFFTNYANKVKEVQNWCLKNGTMAFQLKNCAQISNVFWGLTRFGTLYLHNGSRVCEKKQFIVLYSFGYWSTEKKISLSFEHWPHVLAWRHKLPNFFFSQAKSLDFYTFFKLVY